MNINKILVRTTGADPGFSWGRGGGGGGAGRKRLSARTHITSGKPEVPYGHDSGPFPGSGSCLGV